MSTDSSPFFIQGAGRMGALTMPASCPVLCATCKFCSVPSLSSHRAVGSLQLPRKTGQALPAPPGQGKVALLTRQAPPREKRTAFAGLGPTAQGPGAKAAKVVRNWA